VKALVFDRQPEARSLWQKVCSEFAVETDFFDHWMEVQFPKDTGGSIYIIDQNTIGTSIHTATQICRQFPKCAVVFTGSDLSIPVTVQLMSCGAAWVFRKALVEEATRAGFQNVHSAAVQLENDFKEHERLQSLIQSVSDREKAVLDKVLSGVSNRQIAVELQVSVRTVEARRAKIYKKCEVQTVTELVRRVDQAATLSKRFGEIRKSSAKNGSHNRMRQVDTR
jgi:FixJ family two-component response regulator